MIVSRYLSEPGALPHTPPLPVSGSESFTRLNAWWRVIRRAVRDLASGQPGPFERLEFWTVRSHPLVDRLKPYQPTGVSFFRRCSWQTLIDWQELTDTPRWPDPDSIPARRYVPEYEMST